MRREYGDWDVDRFASDHNATCPRFNALAPSRYAEAIDAFGQDWSEGVSYVLPDFHKIDRVLDMVERDDAAAVLVFPKWTAEKWWRRLHAPCWQRRVTRQGVLPPFALVARDPATCFFKRDFDRELIVMRVDPIGAGGAPPGGARAALPPPAARIEGGGGGGDGGGDGGGEDDSGGSSSGPSVLLVSAAADLGGGGGAMDALEEDTSGEAAPRGSRNMRRRRARQARAAAAAAASGDP